jgi:hypothetical protein
LKTTKEGIILNQKAPLTSKFDGCQITRNVWQKVTFKMLPYLDQVFRFWEGSLLICGILAFAVASTLSAILPVYTIELLPNSHRPIFYGIFFAMNRLGVMTAFQIMKAGPFAGLCVMGSLGKNFKIKFYIEILNCIELIH